MLYEIIFAVVIALVFSLVYITAGYYYKQLNGLYDKGCFEKDGITLKLDDFNRTDFKIVSFNGGFFICPT